VLDRTFDLGDVAAAHEYMEANKNIGKLVLKM
jgi:NADPH:quinone reductase-like Zn-dependent oxidoreductase